MSFFIEKEISDLEKNNDFIIEDGDRGKNYPKSSDFDSKGYCVFLNTGNIVNDCLFLDNLNFITKEKDLQLRKGKMQYNDIILTTRGTVGSVAYYGDNIKYKNMRINSGMIIIRVNENNIHSKYLYQVLKSPYTKKIIALYSSGSAQPQLPIKDFRKIALPIPKMAIQKKIAGILGAYDDLIENNNKRIKILEEMAHKIYKEWFVDFKFPGYEKTKFKKTELGVIPEDWEVNIIASKYKTILGGTPSRNNPKYWNGNVPWINSSKTNEIRICECSEFITNDGLSKSSTKLMPKYTSVLAITGATLGQVSMLTKEMCANQSVIGIYDEKNEENEFIYYMLKQNINNIINYAGGGAQQHINKDIVNETRFIHPKTSNIKKFKNIISAMNDNIINLIERNQTLKQIRYMLLSKLISGEIDVEDLEVIT